VPVNLEECKQRENSIGLLFTTWKLRVLLQRVHSVHPTVELLEAADLQWWWRTPRSSDNLPQLFWFDQLGRPELQ
jgi:hypothetical protein